MRRVQFDEFHGFPVTHFGDDDIEEAGRGRLHGDFIESQLDTRILSSTDNGDDGVSKILTVVSTNNPGVKNGKADSDLEAWRLIKPRTDRVGFVKGNSCNGDLYGSRILGGHSLMWLDTNAHPHGGRQARRNP